MMEVWAAFVRQHQEVCIFHEEYGLVDLAALGLAGDRDRLIAQPIYPYHPDALRGISAPEDDSFFDVFESDHGWGSWGGGD